MSAYPKWGTYHGHYTYDVTWRGVPVTVECEVPTYDEEAIFAVRVLAGGVDITDLIEDMEDGVLCDLLMDQHVRRHEANTPDCSKVSV